MTRLLQSIRRTFSLQAASLLAMAAMSLPAMSQISLDQFPSNTPQSGGSWVKVKIPETGVYSISYGELRQMGFQNPSKVAAYGRGGWQMDEQLAASDGSVDYDFEIPQIATLHSGDRIYFYVNGPEHIEWATNGQTMTKYALGGSFVNQGLNIYNSEACCFLTDRYGVAPIQTVAEAPEAPVAVSYGVDYRYHEQDLAYNTTNSGKIYWGEVFTPKEDTMGWQVQLPGLEKSVKGVSRANVYYNDYCGGSDLWFGPLSSFGEGAAVSPTTTPTYYTPVSNAAAETRLNNENERMTVQFAFSHPSFPGKAYLDYWLLTWAKRTPSLATEAQSRLLLHKVTSGQAYALTDYASSAVDMVAWDVSDLHAVKSLLRADNKIYGTADVDRPMLVMFDRNQPQLQISGYETVSVPDLHAQALQGADMLIITTPRNLSAAQRIAALHESHDRMKVMVAQVADIYNAFSQGMADPMAYKWLAKMLSLHPDRSLKNVLFLGRMLGDLRGRTIPVDPAETMIAFQNAQVSRTAGATNANDFYGMLDDYYSYGIASWAMTVGVGVLPVRSSVEAEIVADKIERYMETQDFDAYANNFVWYTCPGDTHMSEISALAIVEKLESVYPDCYHIMPVVIDDYTSAKAARDDYFSKLSQGALWNIYVGHGDPQAFSLSHDVLTGPNLRTLLNEPLSFAIYAGCSLANFDRGESGIGEKTVLNLRNGMIGGIMASRETYNNENNVFVQQFVRSIGYDLDNQLRTSPPDIGEVYRGFKNRLGANNKHAYNLICDPALRIPFPQASIGWGSETLKGKKGNFLTLEGTVRDQEGQMMKNFSGHATVRLYGPTVERRNASVQTGTQEDFFYPLPGAMLATAGTEVENGRFTVHLAIPSDVEYEQCVVTAAAFAPEERISAAVQSPVDIVDTTGPKPLDDDTRKPSISDFAYDDGLSQVSMALVDDVCLNLNLSDLNTPYAFSVDGQMLPPQNAQVKDISDHGRKAVLALRLPRYMPGEHVLDVTCSDLAGNLASAAFSFQVGGCVESMAISVEQQDGDVVVTLEEGQDAGCRFYVADSAGKVVAQSPAGLSRWKWESPAAQLPEGLYKVWARGQQACSAPVYLPLLAQ